MERKDSFDGSPFPTDVTAEAVAPVRWGFVLFLVVMALVFGAPGFGLIGHELSDGHVPSSAVGPMVFCAVLFCLPSLLCGFLALRAVTRDRDLLPCWLWRILALLLTAVCLAVAGGVAATGKIAILGPLVVMVFLTRHAWRLSRRPPPPAEQGIELVP